MGIRCADHVTPLYPQKLALTSPTGGGRSVGIVRSRTKVTEFFFNLRHYIEYTFYFFMMAKIHALVLCTAQANRHCNTLPSFTYVEKVCPLYNYRDSILGQSM